MSAVPSSYAFNRDWAVPESLEIGRNGAIQANWDYSKRILSEIRAALEAESLPVEILTVAVAGSFGRMDASDNSDCDLLVVLQDNLSPEEASAQAHYDRVWQAMSKVQGFSKPKPGGIFARPTTRSQLLDNKKVGAADEDMRVFAKRLLLLMECQPVYGDTAFQELVKSVIDGYAGGYVADDPRKEWVFLINDLVRYFRSLCVNYQWDFRNEPRKWVLRNIKLRHSRVVMYAGLLALLGECSKDREDKVTWLRDRLMLTPLERLAWVYAANNDQSFFRVAGFYDCFLHLLNKRDVREELSIDPSGPSYARRYQLTHFAALKANSDGLIAELMRFILGRRGSWTERFFEYLLF
jgi:hypothetical protein